MSSINLELPTIVPDVRSLFNGNEYEDSYPYIKLFNEPGALLGIVHDIQEDYREILDKILTENEGIEIRLILLLYPACLTKEEDLKAFFEFQEAFKSRCKLRLYLAKNRGIAPSSSLVFWTKSQNKPVMIFGNSIPFPVEHLEEIDFNFCFNADTILAQLWKNRFELLWEKCSIALKQHTVKIPALVPAKGTKDASLAWEEYYRLCKNTITDDEKNFLKKIEVDDETGEVKIILADGTTEKTETEKLNIPKYDKFAGELAKIFKKGNLITVDKTTRIPPLDAPIKPELLGFESSRRVGSVSRKIEFKISLIDEKTLRDLNNKRTKITPLFNKFSFNLADGVRWIPFAAKELLAKEMERIENEGKQLLNKTLGGPLEKFVENQTERVKKDLESIYNEIYPGEALPDNVVKNVIEELKMRLEKAINGNFLPKISYASIEFSLDKEEKHLSAWGQALSLLADSAKFSRKLLTDNFMMRDVKCAKQEELLLAMDVCEDLIVKYRKKGNIYDRAKEELEQIKKIMESEKDQKTKCEELWNIIRH